MGFCRATTAPARPTRWWPHGIKTTAGVVTAAAVVMDFVFGTFATPSIVSLKEMGIGLAVAVLLNVTVVRALLLSATMKLVGRHTLSAAGCRLPR